MNAQSGYGTRAVSFLHREILQKKAGYQSISRLVEDSTIVQLFFPL